MTSWLKIMQGDCVEQMRTLPEGSIDLVVTSPPYDDLRSYKGNLKWDFEGTAKELYRVLSEGGVVCWNVGSSVVDGSESLTAFKQAIYFVEQAGFRLHDRMIWEKTNFAHPESVRYHQLFEDVFILSKGAPRIFNPIKDKPNAYAGSGTFGKNTMRQPSGEMVERKRNIINAFGMRGNVWRGKTRGQEDMCKGQPHPAMMPKWLARDLILSWSNAGDTVLDPFAGSGTTLQEALKLGRRAIGCEKEPDYVKLIEQRCDVTRGMGW